MVAIGTDIEASVLTVLALAEAGVPDIWAKAITRKHGQILERVGAHHVVYPEFSMGERVAHMLTGGMMDYIEFDDEFSIARTLAPPFTWDKTLAESAPRSKHGVTIVGVKRTGEDFTYARPETTVSRHDHLIVSGPTAQGREVLQPPLNHPSSQAKDLPSSERYTRVPARVAITAAGGEPTPGRYMADEGIVHACGAPFATR